MHRTEASELKKALLTLDYVLGVEITHPECDRDTAHFSVRLNKVTRRRPDRVMKFVRAWVDASVAHDYTLQSAEMGANEVALIIRGR